jgi:hypothetical protein
VADDGQRRVPRELNQPGGIQTDLDAASQKRRTPMGASKPVTVSFHRISRLQYRKIRARIRVQAYKMTLPDEETGSAEGGGVKISWTYSEADQVLSITCTARPWWMSESSAAGKIRDLVEGL